MTAVSIIRYSLVPDESKPYQTKVIVIKEGGLADEEDHKEEESWGERESPL